MKTFRIMVTKYGYAVVQAENEDEALHLVNDMEDSDFDWSSDYTADDAQIVDELNPSEFE